MEAEDQVAQLENQRISELESTEKPVLALNFVDDLLITGQVVNLEVEVEGIGKTTNNFDAQKLQNQLRNKLGILQEILTTVDN